MIYIKSSKIGKQVGCITSDIDLEITLEDSRPIIDAELNISNYQFMVWGTSLRKKQERKCKLRQCLSKTGKDVFELELDICENKPADDLHKSGYDDMPEDESPLRVGKEEADSYISKGSLDVEAEDVEETGHKEGKTIKSDVKKKMPKIYSKEDIECATKYLERERKVFHNMKIQAIENDSFFRDWNHTEISGVIDVDWTLKKTTLLKNGVKEIICSDDDTKENPVERTLMKHLEELEKAQFMVDQHYKQLCQDLKIKGEEKRDELEREFDKTFSKLKVVQSNLVKAIEQYKLKQISKDTIRDDGLFDNNALDPSDPQLSSDEMDQLVNTVQDSYD